MSTSPAPLASQAPIILSELLRSPRTPHLLRLWEEVRSLPQVPQMDRWLAQRFRSEKRFGQKDRRWYAEAIFAAFRYGLWAAVCEEMEEQKLKEIPAPWLALEFEGAWAALRTLPAQKLFAWLSLRAGTESHPTLELWSQLRQEPAAAWLWEGLAPAGHRFADDRIARGTWSEGEAQAFLAAQSSRPPIWLRVNRAERSPAVRAELLERGWLIDERAGAFALSPQARLGSFAPFEAGWIELQDLASQEIGAALPLEPQDWVWDVCAGGGGKTMQIAARLGSTGQIIASDIRGYKLKDIEERAARAQFKQIRCLPWDGLTLPTFPSALQRRGGFDCVLVDAPCTGAGTWRRNPDARFRLGQASLKTYTEIQDQVLTRAAAAVKPKGFLVYATCSWLPDENEERIASFLRRFPDFMCLEQKLVGCPREDADTMFVARLQRQ